VPVALAAAEILEEEGRSVRVVSLPCLEAFRAQPAEYRSSVLGEGIPRISLEAGSTFGWGDIVGSDGLSIGIDRFGASAPAKVIAEQFGFTGPAVASRIRPLLD
jgi:transketolase